MLSPVVPPRGPLLAGELLDRPNRYLARVRVARTVIEAHVPNPGRMLELMTPGRPVQLARVDGEHRKTGHDVQACWYHDAWVCIDNRLGGRLARLALEAHAVPELEPYQSVTPEVRLGASRLDFRLDHPGGVTWVEVKSCTLVESGHGRFPDAPTERGRRHLGELTQVTETGVGAAVLFLIQRPDARSIGPNDETDPRFGAALRAAAAAGVRLLAYRSRWTEAGLELLDAVPVCLG